MAAERIGFPWTWAAGRLANNCTFWRREWKRKKSETKRREQKEQRNKSLHGVGGRWIVEGEEVWKRQRMRSVGCGWNTFKDHRINGWASLTNCWSLVVKSTRVVQKITEWFIVWSRCFNEMIEFGERRTHKQRKDTGKQWTNRDGHQKREMTYLI